MPRRRLATVAALAALALCAPATAQRRRLRRGRRRAGGRQRRRRGPGDALPAQPAARRATASARWPRTPRCRPPRRATRSGWSAQGFFDHESPDGGTLVDRLTGVGYLGGDDAWVVGENIGWGQASLATARSMVTAWMNSAGHRENLLSARLHRGRPRAGARHADRPDVGRDLHHRLRRRRRRRRPPTRAPRPRSATRKKASRAASCARAASARRSARSAKPRASTACARSARVAAPLNIRLAPLGACPILDGDAARDPASPPSSPSPWRPIAPAGAAASTPSANPPGAVRLSDERTTTRWAHTADLQPVFSRPSDKAHRVARLRLLTEDKLPEVYLVLARWKNDAGNTWLKIRVPDAPQRPHRLGARERARRPARRPHAARRQPPHPARDALRPRQQALQRPHRRGQGLDADARPGTSGSARSSTSRARRSTGRPPSGRAPTRRRCRTGRAAAWSACTAPTSRASSPGARRTAASACATATSSGSTGWRPTGTPVDIL